MTAHPSGMIPLAVSSFERAARSMCDEYGLEPTTEQVTRFAMHLANRQYQAEVAPLLHAAARLAAVQPMQAVRHADGKVTLLARTISPTEKLLHKAIEQARVHAFQGL